MYQEPKGYWSSVFYQTTMLMRTRRGVSPDDAFLMARHIVDENLEQGAAEAPPLPLNTGYRAFEMAPAPELALAP